jgi:Methyltransferase FkbM domain
MIEKTFGCNSMTMFSQNDAAKNMSLIHRIKSYKYLIDTYIAWFFMIRARYRNYISVIYHLLKGQYPINVVIRNGNKIMTFNHFHEVYSNIVNLDCDLENDIAFVDGLRFYGGKSKGDIVGIFMRKEYDDLPVKDKVVIDIGASIGDSSIYFAIRGAKKVLAFEPDPEAYELAKKNIQINGFSDQIELVYAVCAGTTSIDSPDFPEPKLTTLQTIVDKCDLKPDVLKMDCEGCEYDVILSTPNDVLIKFSYLHIEYHYGYKNIKEKLEKCNFRVRVTEPVYFLPPISQKSTTKFYTRDDIKHISSTYYGSLYAERLDAKA